MWNPQPAASHRPAVVPWEGKANLSLEQITPAPKMTAPATQPAERAPVESLALYAEARDATIRGQFNQAIDALQKAILLDPFRFELRYDLGWAFVNANATDDSAIGAFEKAALLNPDHLVLQTELGRLYLAKSNLPGAVNHLRLALLTSDYQTNDGGAAVADFFLARALKDAGFDRAALNQYTILLKRFEHPSLSLSENPELSYMLTRPDSLFVQVGELMERHGEYGEAVSAFAPAIDREPDNFELQSRYARDLALDGRRDAALEKAVDLIVRDRATPQTLLVLREVCTALNLPDGEVATLKKLSASRPNDHAMLFALTDTLVTKNRAVEARQLLETAWNKSPADIPLTRRLFAMDKTDVSLDSTARLLIHALSANPDATRNYAPLWKELMRPRQANRIKLSTLATMQVPSGDEAARQYWLAVSALAANRSFTEQSALEAAVHTAPPFSPAYRMLLDFDWNRSDWSDQQKIEASNQLMQTAKAGGDGGLSFELSGRSQVFQNNPAMALDSFARAIQGGNKSPELTLAIASAGRTPGRDAAYERNLWKLISDHPLFEDGYLTLFQYYNDPAVVLLEQAGKVLSTWLANDPQSVTARLSEVEMDLRQGSVHDAEMDLSRLFVDDPNDPDIFKMMQSFYSQTGRTDELIGKLEDEHTRHPRDTETVRRLVALFDQEKRDAEAIRLLDATRLAVADDSDLLYSLKTPYNDLNQKDTVEDLLQQIVQLDPGHARACNYLGFVWADAGKNLQRAEELIRTAVSIEPDNSTFLDSLGWVLYKRGNFIEAQKYLQQAIGPSALPDTELLDHLGDTLYRLGRNDDAKQIWQRCLKELDLPGARNKNQQLRLQLLQKIKAVEGNGQANVAAVPGPLSVVRQDSEQIHK